MQEEVVRNGTGVLYVIGVIEESNLCCIWLGLVENKELYEALKS